MSQPQRADKKDFNLPQHQRPDKKDFNLPAHYTGPIIGGRFPGRNKEQEIDPKRLYEHPGVGFHADYYASLPKQVKTGDRAGEVVQEEEKVPRKSVRAEMPSASESDSFPEWMRDDASSAAQESGGSSGSHGRKAYVTQG